MEIFGFTIARTSEIDDRIRRAELEGQAKAYDQYTEALRKADSVHLAPITYEGNNNGVPVEIHDCCIFMRPELGQPAISVKNFNVPATDTISLY